MCLVFKRALAFVSRGATSYLNDLIIRIRIFFRKYPEFKSIFLIIRPYVLPLIRRFKLHGDYKKWIAKYGIITSEDESAMRDHIAQFPQRPLLSVVMATYETRQDYLEAAIRSVQDQIYDNWELCIADDGSLAPHVGAVLRQAMAQDPRIHVIFRSERGHISAASNSALALATGEWVVLMDHDDLIPRNALYELAAEALDYPDAQMIYTDEDKIDDKGERYGPYFKPDFDPDLLLGQNVVSHLTAYRRDLINAVGGFRKGFEGSQDHDLALRATAVCGVRAVRHIPHVLYHWRQGIVGTSSFSERSMSRCIDASHRAVTEHLQMQGIDAEVQRNGDMWHRVVFPLPVHPPLVSVIIPTNNGVERLRVCLGGLLKSTRYPALEVLLADNGITQPATLQFLQDVQADPRVRVLNLSGPFNSAQLTNSAAAQTRGDILLLLNDDIEVIDENWLREMVSQAIRPDVGAVGCRLLYLNGRLRHGGTVVNASGVGVPFMGGAHRDDSGPNGLLGLLRSTSAVTSSCLVMRKEVWKEVGGIDEINLTAAFNDVDLCLKIRARGLRVVWTPFAELYQHDSAPRGHGSSGERAGRFEKEIHFMQQRWGKILLKDPYYSPNYMQEDANFKLAYPPKRVPRYRQLDHTEIKIL